MAKIILAFKLVFFSHCVAPESIHTPPTEGHWKFLGGGGVFKANLKAKSMKLNWNFLGGEGVQNKPSVREYAGYFLELRI